MEVCTLQNPLKHYTKKELKTTEQAEARSQSAEHVLQDMK